MSDDFYKRKTVLSFKQFPTAIFSTFLIIVRISNLLLFGIKLNRIGTRIRRIERIYTDFNKVKVKKSVKTCQIRPIRVPITSVEKITRFNIHISKVLIAVAGDGTKGNEP